MNKYNLYIMMPNLTLGCIFILPLRLNRQKQFAMPKKVYNLHKLCRNQVGDVMMSVSVSEVANV
eukprot:snap_masked-scaffold_26-processed-gene-0.23-mRNA-1 protein AED:1.00 eAED:1.00 QI:0/0/0/0/1/1/3/0/63